MSKYTFAPFALQPRVFLPWALGGLEGPQAATDITTRRIDVIGAPVERRSTNGADLTRMPLAGASAERITADGHAS